LISQISRSSLFLATAIGLASLAAPAHAMGIDEDLRTWSISPSGNVNIAGDGSSAALSSAAPTTDAFTPDLQDFLGVDSGALDDPDYASEGAAIKKIFSANAGDTLTFNWNFVPNGDSYAFFQVQDQITKLTTQSTPFQHTFTGGNTLVAFGVVDYFDTSGASILNVSNVKYQAVPFPALLPGAIAFGMGILRKRKATQKQP
jgi:hypothetical protein